MTIKWFKSPYNWVISPLTQPKVANQQQQKSWQPHWDLKHRPPEFKSSVLNITALKANYDKMSMSLFIVFKIIKLGKAWNQSPEFSNRAFKLQARSSSGWFLSLA